MLGKVRVGLNGDVSARVPNLVGLFRVPTEADDIITCRQHPREGDVVHNLEVGHAPLARAAAVCAAGGAALGTASAYFFALRCKACARLRGVVARHRIHRPR